MINKMRRGAFRSLLQRAQSRNKRLKTPIRSQSALIVGTASSRKGSAAFAAKGIDIREQLDIPAGNIQPSQLVEDRLEAANSGIAGGVWVVGVGGNNRDATIDLVLLRGEVVGGLPDGDFMLVRRLLRFLQVGLGVGELERYTVREMTTK